MSTQTSHISKDNYFFKKIVALNFIFCVFVVIIHATVPARYGLDMTEYPVMRSIQYFCRCAVPSFFFISGMLFYRMCSFSTLRTKLTKRIKTLLIPYILWNLIFTLIFYAMTHIPAIASRMNMETVVLDAKLFILYIVNSQYSPLWFVKNLMIYTALSPIVLLIIRHKWLGGVSVIGIFIYSLATHAEYMSPAWGLPVYLLGALLGYWIYSNDRNLQKDAITRFIPERWRIPLALTLCVWFFVTLTMMYADEQYMTAFRYSAPIIIWIVTDILFCEWIDHKFEIQQWMKCTFFIYCTHYFVLNIQQKILIRTFDPSIWAIYSIFIATTIITLAGLIYTATKSRKNKIYKVLNGGR